MTIKLVSSPTLPPNYIPKDKRKKILLLSDDCRMPSGVGTISRELILGTAHVFNWIQLGAGINHPEHGKILDASDSVNKELNIPDSFLQIMPFNGYGDPNVLRFIMATSKPDAIVIFTDPRYWVWLFSMEAEIRSTIPIVYLNIWDCVPYPRYNRDYYRSVDMLFNISRQTHNIVKNVLGQNNVEIVSFEKNEVTNESSKS